MTTRNQLDLFAYPYHLVAVHRWRDRAIQNRSLVETFQNYGMMEKRAEDLKALTGDLYAYITFNERQPSGKVVEIGRMQIE